MYDIIGDVHGYADELKVLLQRLGYSEQNGVWKHPFRKAIFLGDLIDRGPKVRETLYMVRKMIDYGYAFSVMGNHEYNAICYHTQHSHTGEFLRKHSENNMRQYSSTLNAFLGKNIELHGFVQWFKQLPLFLELDGLRVCHASWIQHDIDAIKKHSATPMQDPLFLERSAARQCEEYLVVSNLLKGLEVRLPHEFQFETEGILRDKIRVKWWKEDYQTFGDLSIGQSLNLQDTALPPHFISSLDAYSESEPPVFIGHYGLEGIPKLLKDNICCVDYGIARRGKLVAYRWDGERVLSENKFISVAFKERLAE